MINYPSSKLPDISTTIFTVMSGLATEYQAINLSQGFPDFNCPEELIELVTKYMREGHNQYAPMPGVPRLRQKVSQKTERVYGYLPDPEREVTITSGATEALFAAIAAIVKPGDEVVVLEPCYDAYIPAIRLAGGIPVFVPLIVPDFHVDWNLVKKCICSRTRAIIINTPHNPTGAVMTRQDMETLSAIIETTDIIIISDEVYEHMVYDEQLHSSVLLHPSLRERSIVISSFGKTYHTTGWKIGYAIAPPALTTELRKMHQFLTFSTVTPMQMALADYLDEETHYQNLPAFYQAKRDLFCELLEPSRFQVLPSSGTYFQLLKYDAISNEHDLDFAKRLTQEIGVASIPVSVFYHDKTDNRFLRFCFAKSEDTLREAAERLVKL
ncbi:methionine aminotransferase [Pontibacter sp. 13R65]|uniref:methionine aminotransferase n=1 Tax=Pontibacter sp. 13R65 TaxID=3127458 RepID=UPI00301D3227